MTLPCRKKLSGLLSVITSNYDVFFFFLSCLHLFITKKKLESYKTLCENKDFHGTVMPFEDTKILELKQYQRDHLLFM